MATIDAAIIKALVEHIGGNPDTIPDGIGVKQDYAISPKITMTSTNGIGFTLSSTESLNSILSYGHIIRLKTSSGEIVDFTCIRFQDVNPTTRYFVFAPNDGSTFAMLQIDPSKTVTEATISITNYGTDFELPDNITTGYMTPKFGIGYVLEHISAFIIDLSNRVKALENKT